MTAIRKWPQLSLVQRRLLRLMLRDGHVDLHIDVRMTGSGRAVGHKDVRRADHTRMTQEKAHIRTTALKKLREHGYVHYRDTDLRAFMDVPGFQCGVIEVHAKLTYDGRSIAEHLLAAQKEKGIMPSQLEDH